MYDVTSYLEHQRAGGEDALAVINTNDSVWFCIADGAGGIGGGSFASSMITTAFTKLAHESSITHPDEFESFLRAIDLELNSSPVGGESTAILGVVVSGVVFGASVGDSEAWLFNTEYQLQLTEFQIIKPLIGSGYAKPIGFGPMDLEHIMVVGSDGLFKYTNLKEMSGAVSQGESASQLAALSKKQTGYLQDDISVLVVRRKSHNNTV